MPNSPWLFAGDSFFRKMNTRLRASQLQPGEVALSQNGRMDVDGAWKCREGYQNVSGATLTTADAVLTVAAGTAGELALFADATITSASISSNILIITCSGGHGLTARAESYLVNIDGVAFTTTDPNGNRAMVATSSTNLIATLTAPNETYTITSGEVVRSFVLSSDVIAILGACRYSDPSDSSEEYIVIADNAQATAIKVSDTSDKTEIAYPSGGTLGQDADLEQELDTIVLRQDGKTAWEWDGELSTISAGSFEIGKNYTIVTVGTTDFTLIGAASNTVGASFIATGVGTGSGTARSGFTAVSTTATTQKVFTTTGNTTISSGVVTVAETAHGLEVGDKIRIVDSGLIGLLDGSEYQVATVPGANSFTINAEVDDTAAAQSVVYSTKASIGGGYVAMPGAPWGVYHQRRSWLPYTYDSQATPVSRGVQDEIIASDILDNKTYDPIGNQFRLTGGSADFLVGLHGFDDDRLIAFNRNSIHYLRGISGSLGDVETIQLTDEIGCLARKSIVSYANQVLFLSDQGVYAVSFLDEYNLRGVEMPLSESVDSIIERITPGSADKAVAVYHDDRYWLAIPIDGSEVNNALLIYNFTNQGWESLDTTNASNWGIIELIQARAGKVNELYAVTTLGGVHKIDGTFLDKDRIANTVGQSSDTVLDIPAELKTRQYDFGAMGQKKFNRIEAHFKSDNNYVSQGDLSVITEDPDSVNDLGEIRDEFAGGIAAAEDATIEKRIGNPRGNSAQFRFAVESGLPSVRAIQIKAIGAMGSATSSS